MENLIEEKLGNWKSELEQEETDRNMVFIKETLDVAYLEKRFKRDGFFIIRRYMSVKNIPLEVLNYYCMDRKVELVFREGEPFIKICEIREKE